MVSPSPIHTSSIFLQAQDTMQEQLTGPQGASFIFNSQSDTPPPPGDANHLGHTHSCSMIPSKP